MKPFVKRQKNDAADAEAIAEAASRPTWRDFAAWLGLVPRQSTGSTLRLGKTSKMGQRDIPRLLIMAVSDGLCAAEPSIEASKRERSYRQTSTGIGLSVTTS